MKKDDLLIAMLRIGKENISTGITRKEIIKHLKELKIEGAFTDNEHVSGQFERFWERFYELDRVGGVHSDKRYLSIDGYFRLLEYEELEEARASSKQALWVAIVAMVISAVSAIASICISLFHTSDVKFANAQPVIIEGSQKVMVEGIPKVSIEGIPTVKLEGSIPDEKQKMIYPQKQHSPLITPRQEGKEGK